MLERGFKNPEPGPPLLSSALAHSLSPSLGLGPRTLRVAHTSTCCGLSPASAATATTTNLLSPLAWRQPPTTHLPSPPPCRTPAPHHPQGNLPHRAVTPGPSPRKSFSAVKLTSSTHPLLPFRRSLPLGSAAIQFYHSSTTSVLRKHQGLPSACLSHLFSTQKALPFSIPYTASPQATPNPPGKFQLQYPKS